MQHGYSRQQSDEIIRLAHQLFRPGTQAPPRITLAPTGIQSGIRREDLVKARDFLMTVTRLPRVPVSDIMSGTTQDPESGRLVPVEYTVRDRNGRSRREQYEPPMFGGPERRLAAMAQAPIPAPVRTYTYSVSLNDAMGRTYEFEISLNRDPRRAEGRGLIAQMNTILGENTGIIAITSGERQVSVDEFRDVYRRVYRDTSIAGSQASIDIHGRRERRGG
jgi:hypothetical protein